MDSEGSEVNQFWKSLLDLKWWFTVIIASMGVVYSYSNSQALKQTKDETQDARLTVLESTTNSLQKDVRYLVMRECLKDPNRDINPNCNGVK